MRNRIVLAATYLLTAFSAPVFAGDALTIGMWHGIRIVENMPVQYSFKVQKNGAAFMAAGIEWNLMTEEQALGASKGQKPQNDGKGFCIVRQYAIKVAGNEVTFAPTPGQAAAGKLWSPEPFTAKLVAPGLAVHNSADDNDHAGVLRFWQDDAFKKPLPFDLEKGKTQQLACVDGGKYHYSCYIPKSYDPEKPAPVMVNFNPGGNAAPFSEKMAEETGWIMAGLTESQNGPYNVIYENRDSAVFDLRRRLNIDMKHLYFSGFSGGARASSLSSMVYGGSCTGLILIGASYEHFSPNFAPPKEQAIFFIVGQRDPNHGEVVSAYEKAKQAGRKCQLAEHPGEHEWGPEIVHEAAISWLVKETTGAKAAK